MNRLGIQSLNAGAPDLRFTGDQTQRGSYVQRRRNQMAYGGIAGADGRKRYGLGSFFQKYIKDPIEMAVTGKNPTQIENESQARVDREQDIVRDIPADFDPTTDRLADITPTDPGTGPYTPWYEQLLHGDMPSTGNQQLDQLIGTTAGQFLPFTQPITDEGQQGRLPFGLQDFMNLRSLESLQPFLKKEVSPRVAGRQGAPIYSRQTTQPGQTGGAEIIGYQPDIPEQAAKYEHRVNPLYPIAGGLGAGIYSASLPRDVLPADQTGIDFSRFQTAEAAKADPNLRFKSLMSAAQGGRIRAQEGGLMNLGGLEKDYRQEGGFVPLGGEEKADDVPARLSKNEFVFTADAVRAAGGGDIDAGAEVMENVMENLEAGGEISEESQGLEGARGMFANAQQLEKRII